jgi:hypothetical protein
MHEEGAIYELWERLPSSKDCSDNPSRLGILVDAALELGDVDLATRTLEDSRGHVEPATLEQWRKRLEGVREEKSQQQQSRNEQRASEQLAQARKLLTAGDCSNAAKAALAAHDLRSPYDEALSVFGKARQCQGDGVGARRAFGRAAFELDRKQEQLRWIVNYHAKVAMETTWVDEASHLCGVNSVGKRSFYFFMAGLNSPNGRSFGEPYAVTESRAHCCGTPDGCKRIADRPAEPGIVLTDAVSASRVDQDGKSQEIWTRIGKPGDYLVGPQVAGKKYVTASSTKWGDFSHGGYQGRVVLDINTGRTVRKLKDWRDHPDAVAWEERDEQFVLQVYSDPAVAGYDLGTGQPTFRISQAELSSFCGRDREFATWSARSTMLLQCGYRVVEVDLKSSKVRGSAEIPFPQKAQHWDSWLNAKGELMVLVERWECDKLYSVIVNLDTRASFRPESNAQIRGTLHISPDHRWFGGYELRDDGSHFMTLLDVETGRLVSETKLFSPAFPSDRDKVVALGDLEHCQMVFCKSNGDPVTFAWGPEGRSCGNVDPRGICRQFFEKKNGAKLAMPQNRDLGVVVPQFPDRVLSRNGLCAKGAKHCPDSDDYKGRGSLPYYLPKQGLVLQRWDDYLAIWSLSKKRYIGHLVNIGGAGWVWTTEGDPQVLRTASEAYNYTQWATGYTQPVIPGSFDWFWCVSGERVLPNEVCREALFRDDVFDSIMEQTQ